MKRRPEATREAPIGGTGCPNRKPARVRLDRQTFGEIESYDVERGLGELAEDFRGKQHRPNAVRRVYTLKPNTKQRPLGITTRFAEVGIGLIGDSVQVTGPVDDLYCLVDELVEAW